MTSRPSDENPTVVDPAVPSARALSNPLWFGTHAPPPGEGPGDLIGPYRLLSVLGEGGFGVVYLAERREPIVQRVAIKIIKPGMDSRAVIARFEQERQALAVMDHPSVAKVYDAGTTAGGRPYFVMEYVKGEAINRFVQRENLSIPDILRLFVPVCDAIHHAHTKGIIHRDIKPGNILVSAREGAGVAGATPKVIDFGVAKAIAHTLTDKTIFTEQGQILGTPEYMSPEQADLGASDIDTRTDVYSLGVVLYELLSGSLPFDSRTLRAAGYAEIRRIIREVEPPKPSTKAGSSVAQAESEPGAEGPISRKGRTSARTVARQIRGDLDWIILKAMEKTRGRRYNSAAALAEDLERHLRREPVSAGPPSALYRAERFVLRHQGAVVSAALVVLALAGGLVTASIAWANASAARRAEAQERARAETSLQTSREVIAFLNDDLLAAAAPEAMGKDTKVLEVVDAASRAIEGRFGDRPLVEASVRRTLGTTYMLLGELGKARSHLESASALFDNAAAGASDESLDGLSSLSEVYWRTAEHDLAARAAQRVYDERLRALGADAPRTLDALNQLANTFKHAGDMARAEPLYDQCLAARRRVLGERAPDVAITLHNLALLYLRTDRKDRAVDAFTQALDILRAARGPEHPETLATQSELGSALLQVNRPEEALSHFQATRAGQEKILPETHFRLVWTRANEASALVALGRHAEALPLYQSALGASRINNGDAAIEVLVLSRRLGQTLATLGRFDEAESVLLKAQRDAEAAAGNEGVPAQRTRLIQALVDLYEKAGKDQDAARWRSQLPPAQPKSP